MIRNSTQSSNKPLLSHPNPAGRTMSYSQPNLLLTNINIYISISGAVLPYP